MSISGIQGSAGFAYTTPSSKRDNAIAEGAYSNSGTGQDRVSFSEDALKMAQSRTATADKAKLQSDEAQNATARSPSLTELSKTSLFSMLLEGLFLAELEESAADSDSTARGGNEQTNEDGTQRQQPRTTKAPNPLEDGERVAEIKKILTDFTKGKIELSDLPKAMAGVPAGGTGKGTGGTGNEAPREGGSATRSDTEK